ncbi:MAG: acyltransferase family protein [Desulfobacterales bacterium]|nr:acyltransferase family protein [Desulfobacterales bacterium]
MNINTNISRNFSVLKLFSILMVFCGHFFHEIPILWIPVTVGLLIFSFSSGLFTSVKYTGAYSIKKFWTNKLKRLGASFCVINAVLFLLFMVQNKQGLWSWHTLINILGLNGLLNWFYINNISPFGRGMWFLTLLLLFYLVYPFLEKLNKKAMVITSIAFVFAAYYLNGYHGYGHALWLTACGFILGVLTGKNGMKMPPKTGRLFSVIFFLIMMGLNIFFKFSALNFFLLLLFSVSLIFSTCDVVISDKWYQIMSPFTGCIFEIYLLHSYLSVTPTQIRIIDFIISLTLVVFLSRGVNFVSHALVAKFEG